MHRRVRFKRFLYVAMLLLCTGAWVLTDFVCCDAAFVHRRLGFKRFLCVAMLLLCTGAWVLGDFDASLR